MALQSSDWLYSSQHGIFIKRVYDLTVFLFFVFYLFIFFIFFIFFLFFLFLQSISYKQHGHNKEKGENIATKGTHNDGLVHTKTKRCKRGLERIMLAILI